MRSRFMSWASLVACAGMLGQAHAEAIAHASLSDLHIQLIDLRPDDGIAPSLTFSNTSTGVDILGQRGSDYLDESAQGAGEFGSVSLFRDYGNESSSASVSGSFTQGNLLLDASTDVTSNGSLETTSRISSGDASPRVDFSLSPGTVMIFTATEHADARVTFPVGHGSEAASSDFDIGITDLDGNYLTKQNGLTASNNGDDEMTNSKDFSVDLAFINEGTSDKRGELQFYIRARSLSYPAPAVSVVPELPPPLMVSAGLCGLGWRLRRRGAAPAPRNMPTA